MSKILDIHVENWISNSYHSGDLNTTKTALQTSLYCEVYLNEPVRPLFIANAIQHYTKKKKAPRLVKNRDKMNDYDVFVGEV